MCSSDLNGFTKNILSHNLIVAKFIGDYISENMYQVLFKKWFPGFDLTFQNWFMNFSNENNPKSYKENFPF